MSERPGAWKREGPKPYWWDDYQGRLEPSLKEVQTRLQPKGMVPDKPDGIGWWESPTGYALVSLNKGIYHISEFPKRAAVLPTTVAAVPVFVPIEKPLVKPKQQDLFS